MIVRIDQKADEPLYLQIRNQIIAAIARGELEPGAALPSVRALASDLGINLHTVNKAYAVLRDEGYVLMRGRSGAYIADPCEDDRADRARIELAKMEDELFELALAHRARGGSWGEFLECAQAQVARAYGAGERPEERAAREARSAEQAKAGEPGNIERAASSAPAFRGGVS
ncbi:MULTISPECIES: GntR family transcriptional regulator [Gordonibacter]|uniref:GntR family transcriptional regulator n=1 Tax=Gordonibacter faecis TaxID=3047475 RepID=A0ABT7DJZ5_9ACTN|nr:MULTISPECIES: GntR family transcriptional regulator [unclassified Gordonibacter]MDJ1649845.1 GntR family transcriptional regulator [Gordonibacter sp. KGMB12511]HIW75509.1 GntR family transcriptional regulator [Candidatus Gordonibacter avicola]